MSRSTLSSGSSRVLNELPLSSLVTSCEQLPSSTCCNLPSCQEQCECGSRTRIVSRKRTGRTLSQRQSRDTVLSEDCEISSCLSTRRQQLSQHVAVLSPIPQWQSVGDNSRSSTRQDNLQFRHSESSLFPASDVRVPSTSQEVGHNKCLGNKSCPEVHGVHFASVVSTSHGGAPIHSHHKDRDMKERVVLRSNRGNSRGTTTIRSNEAHRSRSTSVRSSRSVNGVSLTRTIESIKSRPTKTTDSDLNSVATKKCSNMRNTRSFGLTSRKSGGHGSCTAAVSLAESGSSKHRAVVSSSRAGSSGLGPPTTSRRGSARAGRGTAATGTVNTRPDSNLGRPTAAGPPHLSSNSRAPVAGREARSAGRRGGRTRGALSAGVDSRPRSAHSRIDADNLTRPSKTSNPSRSLSRASVGQGRSRSVRPASSRSDLPKRASDMIQHHEPDLTLHHGPIMSQTRVRAASEQLMRDYHLTRQFLQSLVPARMRSPPRWLNMSQLQPLEQCSPTTTPLSTRSDSPPQSDVLAPAVNHSSDVNTTPSLSEQRSVIASEHSRQQVPNTSTLGGRCSAASPKPHMNEAISIARGAIDRELLLDASRGFSGDLFVCAVRRRLCSSSSGSFAERSATESPQLRGAASQDDVVNRPRSAVVQNTREVGLEPTRLAQQSSLASTQKYASIPQHTSIAQHSSAISQQPSPIDRESSLGQKSSVISEHQSAVSGSLLAVPYDRQAVRGRPELSTVAEVTEVDLCESFRESSFSCQWEETGRSDSLDGKSVTSADNCTVDAMVSINSNIQRSESALSAKSGAHRNESGAHRNETAKSGAHRNESGAHRNETAKSGAHRNESGAHRNETAKSGAHRNESGAHRNETAKSGAHRNESGAHRNESGAHRNESAKSGAQRSESGAHRSESGAHRNESAKSDRELREPLKLSADLNDQEKKQEPTLKTAVSVDSSGSDGSILCISKRQTPHQAQSHSSATSVTYVRDRGVQVNSSFLADVDGTIPAVDTEEESPWHSPASLDLDKPVPHTGTAAADGNGNAADDDDEAGWTSPRLLTSRRSPILTESSVSDPSQNTLTLTNRAHTPELSKQKHVPADSDDIWSKDRERFSAATKLIAETYCSSSEPKLRSGASIGSVAGSSSIGKTSSERAGRDLRSRSNTDSPGLVGRDPESRSNTDSSGRVGRDMESRSYSDSSERARRDLESRSNTESSGRAGGDLESRSNTDSSGLVVRDLEYISNSVSSMAASRRSAWSQRSTIPSCSVIPSVDSESISDFDPNQSTTILSEYSSRDDRRSSESPRSSQHIKSMRSSPAESLSSISLSRLSEPLSQTISGPSRVLPTKSISNMLPIAGVQVNSSSIILSNELLPSREVSESSKPADSPADTIETISDVPTDSDNHIVGSGSVTLHALVIQSENFDKNLMSRQSSKDDILKGADTSFDELSRLLSEEKSIGLHQVDIVPVRLAPSGNTSSKSASDISVSKASYTKAASMSNGGIDQVFSLSMSSLGKSKLEMSGNRNRHKTTRDRTSPISSVLSHSKAHSVSSLVGKQRDSSAKSNSDLSLPTKSRQISNFANTESISTAGENQHSSAKISKSTSSSSKSLRSFPGRVISLSPERENTPNGNLLQKSRADFNLRSGELSDNPKKRGDLPNVTAFTAIPPTPQSQHTLSSVSSIVSTIGDASDDNVAKKSGTCEFERKSQFSSVSSRRFDDLADSVPCSSDVSLHSAVCSPAGRVQPPILSPVSDSTVALSDGENLKHSQRDLASSSLKLVATNDTAEASASQTVASDVNTSRTVTSDMNTSRTATSDLNTSRSVAAASSASDRKPVDVSARVFWTSPPHHSSSLLSHSQISACNEENVDKSLDMSLSSILMPLPTSFGGDFSAHANSFNHFKIDMRRQLLQEEHQLSQHRMSLISAQKRRILQKIRAQLEQLEQQKRQYSHGDARFSAIGKRQQALMHKMKERLAELNRLKAISRLNWEKRHLILTHYENLIKQMTDSDASDSLCSVSQDVDVNGFSMVDSSPGAIGDRFYHTLEMSASRRSSLMADLQTPVSRPCRRQRNASRSDDSVSLNSTADVLSDQSDLEGRILALEEQLKRRKLEADNLRKEQKRRDKERLRMEEHSLKKQIEIYENRIQATEMELETQRSLQSSGLVPSVPRPVIGRPTRRRLSLDRVAAESVSPASSQSVVSVTTSSAQDVIVGIANRGQRTGSTPPSQPAKDMSPSPSQKAQVSSPPLSQLAGDMSPCSSQKAEVIPPSLSQPAEDMSPSPSQEAEVLPPSLSQPTEDMSPSPNQKAAVISSSISQAAEDMSPSNQQAEVISSSPGLRTEIVSSSSESYVEACVETDISDKSERLVCELPSVMTNTVDISFPSGAAKSLADTPGEEVARQRSETGIAISEKIISDGDRCDGICATDQQTLPAKDSSIDSMNESPGDVISDSIDAKASIEASEHGLTTSSVETKTSFSMFMADNKSPTSITANDTEKSTQISPGSSKDSSSLNLAQNLVVDDAASDVSSCFQVMCLEFISRSDETGNKEISRSEKSEEIDAGRALSSVDSVSEPIEDSPFQHQDSSPLRQDSLPHLGSLPPHHDYSPPARDSSPHLVSVLPRQDSPPHHGSPTPLPDDVCLMYSPEVPSELKERVTSPVSVISESTYSPTTADQPVELESDVCADNTSNYLDHTNDEQGRASPEMAGEVTGNAFSQVHGATDNTKNSSIDTSGLFFVSDEMSTDNTAASPPNHLNATFTVQKQLSDSSHIASDDLGTVTEEPSSEFAKTRFDEKQTPDFSETTSAEIQPLEVEKHTPESIETESTLKQYSPAVVDDITSHLLSQLMSDVVLFCRPWITRSSSLPNEISPHLSRPDPAVSPVEQSVYSTNTADNAANDSHRSCEPGSSDSRQTMTIELPLNQYESNEAACDRVSDSIMQQLLVDTWQQVQTPERSPSAVSQPVCDGQSGDGELFGLGIQSDDDAGQLSPVWRTQPVFSNEDDCFSNFDIDTLEFKEQRIEEELRHLEVLEKLSSGVIYTRQIPNRPPPPYPGSRLVPVQPPQPAVPIDNDGLMALLDSVLSGAECCPTAVDHALCSDSWATSARQQFVSFLQCFVEEVTEEERQLEQRERKKIRAWQRRVPTNLALSVSDSTPHAIHGRVRSRFRKALQPPGDSSMITTSASFAASSGSSQDPIYQVLVQELREERREWLDYSSDLEQLKQKMADQLISQLIDELVGEVQRVWHCRHVRQTPL